MKNKSHLIAAALLALAASPSFAQPDHAPAHGARAKQQQRALCGHCGTVETVREEERKGEGGAAGIVGGAVVGGLLGNQIGGGSGKALATAGGAVAGAYVGNEVQKKATSRSVWVTQVKMRDGTIRRFEQEPRPLWKTGSVVKVSDDNRSIAAVR
ncbi:MAG: glycine zipper 2TM domain-containing protein [Burkholderiales bacterium]|nr:glycine zipper 2TM domain-containing protein [Burkholderiales bacterium]